MMRIPYVPDVALTDVVGEPVDDGKGSPAMMNQRKFFFQRMTDPKFTAGKEGIDAVEFVVDARRQLSEQDEKLVAERGYWLLENEPAKALQTSVCKPTVQQGQTAAYIPMIQHCLLPLLRSARDMVDDGDAKKKEADSKSAPS